MALSHCLFSFSAHIKMAYSSDITNLTVDSVDEYKNFWPRTTKRRCHDFHTRLLSQIEKLKKKFKHEIHCILGAIEHAYGDETERQAIHVTVKPMMLETYKIFYESATVLQSASPPNAVINGQ